MLMCYTIQERCLVPFRALVLAVGSNQPLPQQGQRLTQTFAEYWLPAERRRSALLQQVIHRRRPSEPRKAWLLLLHMKLARRMQDREETRMDQNRVKLQDLQLPSEYRIGIHACIAQEPLKVSDSLSPDPHTLSLSISEFLSLSLSLSLMQIMCMY